MELSAELLGSRCDACWGWLRQLKATSPQIQPPQWWPEDWCDWKSKAVYTCSQPWAAEAEGWWTCLCPSPAAEGRGNSRFSRHSVNAVGIQSPQGVTKGKAQPLHWVQDAIATLMMLTLFHVIVCPDRWASALCCNGWGCRQAVSLWPFICFWSLFSSAVWVLIVLATKGYEYVAVNVREAATHHTWNTCWFIRQG